MKKITSEKIRKVISSLCAQANFSLRRDLLAALKAARAKEPNKRNKRMIGAIIENAAVAKKDKLAICQDTGLPIVFLEVGQGVQITGDLNAAVNKGVEEGYRKAYLRNSVIRDPLLRGSPGYQPAVMHIDMVRGSRLKITLLPKGFGCENKSALKMFRPTAGVDEIKEFIIETVKNAGPDACPPYIVGVGIGGSADYASLLAKKALLRRIKISPKGLERELLHKINKLHIGTMGLGGRVTALGVHIETHPTHIAGLPVAVNISCHALRSATAVL
ncbi:MAG TPA: fumarate hydratase [Candidatus Margulisiibacteriota bacterium]|nr:fumarate hydratase [Candidatus Margulisiibacteriota bacterium]